MKYLLLVPCFFIFACEKPETSNKCKNATIAYNAAKNIEEFVCNMRSEEKSFDKCQAAKAGTLAAKITMESLCL